MINKQGIQKVDSIIKDFVEKKRIESTPYLDKAILKSYYYNCKNNGIQIDVKWDNTSNMSNCLFFIEWEDFFEHKYFKIKEILK